MIIGLGAGILFLILWFMIKGWKEEKTKKRLLEEMGFLPCAEERESLSQKVAEIERNKKHSYSVKSPLRATINGKTVIHYTKERRRFGRDLHLSEEVLIPFRRESPEPLHLTLKPTAMKEGVATSLLRKAASGPWDTMPDGLVQLSLPRDLEGGNILAALAPEGKSLYGLLDAEGVSLVLRAGDHGILALRFHEDLCALEVPMKGLADDPSMIWTFVRHMLSRG